MTMKCFVRGFMLEYECVCVFVLTKMCKKSLYIFVTGLVFTNVTVTFSPFLGRMKVKSV